MLQPATSSSPSTSTTVTSTSPTHTFQPPRIADRAPEVWAGTAPEQVADYLRRTCCRFNNAIARQKGTPYRLSEILYQHNPPSHPAEAP